MMVHLLPNCVEYVNFFCGILGNVGGIISYSAIFIVSVKRVHHWVVCTHVFIHSPWPFASKIPVAPE